MEETVILLHGLARSGLSFWRMERALRAAGYRTLSLSYPSRHAPIPVLAGHLAARLPRAGRLHFVGHSLGGVLALKLIERLPPERRGRVVQLGAPNLGSEMARRARPLKPYLGPALTDLEPGPAALGPRPDVGAIAGTAAPPALSRVTGLKGYNDGVVSAESAFACAAPECRLALPVIHGLMMMDARVIDATIRFLRHGRFD